MIEVAEVESEGYSGVRGQVFEVVVRQALAGAPWREICAGPMQVNNITPEDVEAEVQRRKASFPEQNTRKPNVVLLFVIIVAILVAVAYAFVRLQH